MMLSGVRYGAQASEVFCRRGRGTALWTSRKRLGIAQPPLSQQIRALEEEMGVALLLRTKRRVQLTEAGEIFLNESRKILIKTDQAVRAAQRAARGETGELAVGFVGSAVCGKPILPPAPTTELAVMWRPEDESPCLRSFLEIVRQVAGFDEGP